MGGGKAAWIDEPILKAPKLFVNVCCHWQQVIILVFIISCQDRQKKEECLLKHFPLQSYLDRKHVLLARPGSCFRTDAMFLAHIFVIYPCYRYF